MTATEFAALLHAKQIRRGHWIARCPAHGDKRPSLSIAEGKKYPVVFKCMSQGCTQDEVLKAMGLTWKDLLGDRPAMSKEASARLRDEQTLHALRDLKRALVSPAGALLAGRQYRLDALRQGLDRRIVLLENSMNPALSAIRGRDAKTARFVKRWGWDRLWELYLNRCPTKSG
jgi:hypothetical protein